MIAVRSPSREYPGNSVPGTAQGRDLMISYCSPSAYVAMGDLVGLTVNRRYEVSKKLQAGFYGATWLARDNQTREDVCLKVS